MVIPEVLETAAHSHRIDILPLTLAVGCSSLVAATGVIDPRQKRNDPHIERESCHLKVRLGIPC